MNQLITTEPYRITSRLLFLLALLILIASHVSHAAPPFSSQDINHPQIRAAADTRDWLEAQLTAQPAILGSGIGNTADGKPVIRLFTQRAGIPDIPTQLAGIPIRIHVTGLIYALAEDEDPTARQLRPVPIGTSAGHPDITAGTIGARVRDSAGNVFALSNNHVFANSNDARTKRDVVIQPGSFDDGSSPADDIGTLYDFIPLDFSGGDNQVDAAIALTDASLLGTATLSSGYGAPSAETVSAYLGQPVQKCGRTTGCTQGQVSELAVNLNVCYEGTLLICTKSARFVDQIAISDSGFSSSGDSGSLIVTDDDQRNPVALLFAGSSTRTFGNPIDQVLASFNVVIDGDETAPPPPPPNTLTLIAQGYKTKGVQHVDLSWSGAVAPTVEVWRNDALIETLNNTEHYTDALNVRGKGMYHYQVCETGTTSCSNRVSVSF
ncbi:hypothetical protein GCM10009104_21360 [Marinobacterium maritimum]|uniref:Nal1 C-terminal domain-containing protein n=1 Tax=Marinobacterium maritimum TaxID=500162 RepID=A0ABP3TCQ7_9GAMM